MFLEAVLVINRARYEAEFVVAIDAGKVSIVGVLLQEDTSGPLRPCTYLGQKI